MGVVVALWAGGKLADIVYSRLGIADVKP
jgi:hypothetical protein